MRKELEIHFTDQIKEILTKAEDLSINEVSEILFTDVVLEAIEDEKNEWVRTMWPDKKHRGVN